MTSGDRRRGDAGIAASLQGCRRRQRGEDQATGLELGRRVATEGARISVEDEGEILVVTVDAPVRGPGGLFAILPTYHARATAVAAEEPGS